MTHYTPSDKTAQESGDSDRPEIRGLKRHAAESRSFID